MSYTPLINGTVTVTARDINGNNKAKQFNAVKLINIDYGDGTINIVDTTGSFYFSLTPMTSFTYTITPNPNGAHSLVMF